MFLIFTQQARHKFGCNTMHAKIFSENLMTCGFWNFNFLCYFTNHQTTMEQIICWIFGCFLHFMMLKVVLNVHCPQLKYSPLSNIYTTHGFLFYSWLWLQTLVLTFWKSLKMFSLIGNKISHKDIAHQNHPFLIGKNSPSKQDMCSLWKKQYIDQTN